MCKIDGAQCEKPAGGASTHQEQQLLCKILGKLNEYVMKAPLYYKAHCVTP